MHFDDPHIQNSGLPFCAEELADDELIELLMTNRSSSTIEKRSVGRQLYTCGEMMNMVGIGEEATV